MTANRSVGWVAAIMAVIVIFSAIGGRTEDNLTALLQRFPASVGENKTITWLPGESWVDTGIREHVGYEHLRRANPGGFAAGHTLLIPGRHQVPGLVSDGIVINLPELMDFRLANGIPVAWYPISVGRVADRWHTPEGTWTIINREKNHAWHRPSWAGGGVMPAGPNNPLGDRWIGLSAPGCGLHGTNKPTSIGRTVSHGCIRHFPAHIHELFENVWVGMPVVITYQTITIGRQGGTIYLSVFPDVYSRGTNMPAQVNARLASFGVDGILAPVELERRLKEADGVSRPIFGSDVPVTVNGQPLKCLIGPTIRNGQYFLPLRTVVEQLGGIMTWDSSTKSAVAMRGDKQVAFTIDGQEAFVALNTVFVPIRSLMVNLGGTVDFVPKQGILLTIPPVAAVQEKPAEVIPQAP